MDALYSCFSGRLPTMHMVRQSPLIKMVCILMAVSNFMFVYLAAIASLAKLLFTSSELAEDVCTLWKCNVAGVLVSSLCVVIYS